MVSPPPLDRYDAAAALSVGCLLVVAYLLVPNPTVQYAVWLTIFCVWMAWFVFFGAKWLYGVDR
ncbi:hypothetical protein [Haloarcula montana]|uniref:hypothetical protein n=1 Tax=Haloarcula montana TaxID=3111776 RepID=UPI002D79E34F|nr:hypothetical protein [Haloarcula sp. GH36]